jgi:hypothetical protein
VSSAISRKARDRAYSVHNCLESWQVEILSPSQFFGRIACQHSCAGALQNVLTGFKVTNCARHFHHYIFLVLRATRTHSRKFARIAGNLPCYFLLAGNSTHSRKFACTGGGTCPPAATAAALSWSAVSLGSLSLLLPRSLDIVLDARDAGIGFSMV